MIAALLATALWAIPAGAAAADQVLMRAWYAQNEVCRGDPRPTRMCRWRDDTGRILSARGWAWSSRWGWRKKA